MEGNKYATYLNMLSSKNTLYSFDDKLQKVISITAEPDGTASLSSMSIESAHNKLKEKLINACVNISKVVEELIEDKPASNGGKDNVQ